MGARTDYPPCRVVLCYCPGGGPYRSSASASGGCTCSAGLCSRGCSVGREACPSASAGWLTERWEPDAPAGEEGWGLDRCGPWPLLVVLPSALAVSRARRTRVLVVRLDLVVRVVVVLVRIRLVLVVSGAGRAPGCLAAHQLPSLGSLGAGLSSGGTGPGGIVMRCPHFALRSGGQSFSWGRARGHVG